MLLREVGLPLHAFINTNTNIAGRRADGIGGILFLVGKRPTNYGHLAAYPIIVWLLGQAKLERLNEVRVMTLLCDTYMDITHAPGNCVITHAPYSRPSTVLYFTNIVFLLLDLAAIITGMSACLALA